MDERYQPGSGAPGTHGNGSGMHESVATETAGEFGGVLQEQVDKGYHKAAEMLSGALTDLDEVAKVLDERGRHQASSLMHSATGRAERVSEYLENTKTQELVSDANEYARKHIWTVVAAGVAIGLLTSRFIRAAAGGPFMR